MEVEGGVCIGGEEGTSREGGLSGAGCPVGKGTNGDDGLRDGLCDVEVSTKCNDLGLVRLSPGRQTPEVELCGILVDKAKAEGLILGVLVFPRFILPPRAWQVCS